MSHFHLLSEAMQRRIYKMGWPALNAVQEAAIPALMCSDDDVVIAAETASGKTEAAFLPLLSLIESTYVQGIKVLYVSPLKALINDQFDRIQALCDDIGVPVHRWHGDVSQHSKKRTVAAPAGILQITPESIESLFINRTSDLHRLFRSLQFVVIDEVHAFLGSDRGTHLRSLLGRLQALTTVPLRYIALSATIGDYEYAKAWLRPTGVGQVKVLVPAGPTKSNQYCVMHFPLGEGDKRPMELYEDLRGLTRTHSALIFCNARGEVEETVYNLNRLAQREGAENAYLPHHSSIDAAERTYVETTLKSGRRPLSVVATGTLEMGIDIGDVDLVVQIDSTYTVSSLKQRLGRSGRRPGSPRVFQLYSTSDAGLLQAIAATELFLEGWTEPPRRYAVPFDVLLHQILSLCTEGNGRALGHLLAAIGQCEVFREIAEDETRKLIQHMLDQDYLERLGNGEIIVGIEGERIVRSRDFYAVFQTADLYEVIHNTRTIGTLSREVQYVPGAHLILAGKVWSVAEVDPTKNRIYVQPASAAKRPIFGGDPVPVEHVVRSRMAEVLYSGKPYPYLYGPSIEHLSAMRIEPRQLGLNPQKRLITADRHGVRLHSFAGDRVAKTLALWIEHVTGQPVTIGPLGTLRWKADLIEAVSMLDAFASESPPTAKDLVDHVSPDQLLTTKFGVYLPDWAKRVMHASASLDIHTAHEYLNTVELHPITGLDR